MQNAYPLEGTVGEEKSENKDQIMIYASFLG